MDMTRDFFFSYSFEITNTIQHHLTLAPLRPTGKITPGQVRDVGRGQLRNRHILQIELVVL